MVASIDNNSNQRLLPGSGGKRPVKRSSNNNEFVANVEEKRYLWTARAFAIVLAVSMCCNIILLLAIAQVIPLYRVEPFLLTFQNKEEQIYNIRSVNSKFTSSKSVTEVFIRNMF